jgi:hypothetical protein
MFYISLSPNEIKTWLIALYGTKFRKEFCILGFQLGQREVNDENITRIA